MKTFKRYVVNQTYPEGSIAECFLMEESMLYAMNYMPGGGKKGYGWMSMVHLPTLLIGRGRSIIFKMYSMNKHASGYCFILLRMSNGRGKHNLDHILCTPFFVL